MTDRRDITMDFALRIVAQAEDDRDSDALRVRPEFLFGVAELLSKTVFDKDCSDALLRLGLKKVMLFFPMGFHEGWFATKLNLAALQVRAHPDLPIKPKRAYIKKGIHQ